VSVFVSGSIGSPRASGWAPNGTALVTLPRNQLNPTVTIDGAGGAIVAWQDSRSSSGEYHQFDIYARRIGASGVPMWTDNGVAICTMTSGEFWPVIVADGSGGAIIAWTRTDGPVFSYWDIYAQRVNAAGIPLWPENGVPVCTASGFQVGQGIVENGAGGAIIAWYDSRATGDVYAQHMSASGTALWTANGVPLCLKQGRQQYPVIASDGAGGAIVAWEDTSSSVTTYDIYAQRIDGSGTVLWTTNGVPLCTLPDRQRDTQIIADGVGGAVVVWRDERTWPATDLYMQRVNSSGAVQWAANGVALCTAAGWQSSPTLAREGDKVLVTWADSRNGSSDIYAQRIDMSGNADWGTDGIALCSAQGSQAGPNIVSDEVGGAIVAWTDWRGPFTDVYSQRVTADGVVLWAVDGDAVCTAAEYQFLGGMTSDGEGGALMSWSDCRDLAPDVYAERVGPNGPVTRVDGPPSVDAFQVLQNYPNPFAETTDIEVELPGNVNVVTEVFDVGGRRLRADAWGTLPLGWNRLTIHGRDERARELPSGVYFLRITAGNSAVTRKIVIAR